MNEMARGRPDPATVEKAIAQLATVFSNRLVTSRAIREQHGNTTTWIASEPPDAVIYPQSADDVQQTLPMMIACARGVHVAVVVGPAALALVGLAGRIRAKHAAIASPPGWFVRRQLAGVGDSTEVDHGFLHRYFDPLATARELALVERRQNANGRMQAGTGVADGRSWLQRPAVHLTRGA